MKRILGMAVAGLLVAAGASAQNALAVNAGAALRGTDFGLQVTCREGDVDTANVYVQSDHPKSEKHYRARWVISPDTINIPRGKALRIAAMSDDLDDNHIVIFMKRSQGDQFQARLWYKVDGGVLTAGPQIFLMNALLPSPQPASRTLEIEWTAATGAGANNGTAFIRRFNDLGTVQQAELTIGSLDTDTKEISHFRMGILGGTGNPTNCATTGTNYNADEFESYR